MFKGNIKADFLKGIIEATSILVDEVKLRITSDGLFARAVDPAHVGMIDFKLLAGAFEEYEADEESELGIDLDKIRGILKLASGEDIVSLSYGKEERLVIQIGNLTRKIGLLDTSTMPDTKIPSLDLPAEVIIKTDELYKGIKASEAITDHIILQADPEGFELSAEGDTDTVKLKIPKSQLSSLKCNEEVKSMFALDYFSDMVKSVKSDEVTLYLGNDYPVKMMFHIAGENGEVMYLLAPRIESE
ncbi:MAG: proliferating cell nuclear antigen (pcna) [Thermoplasmata archaeon]|nr:MAG: proliferating cell nuclear antigen (pcna) [Thermoplasmata archaeon]